VNCIVFVILVQIVEQVPVDILSVGGVATLSSTECPTYPG